MTEDVITELSKIKKLKVFSRSAVLSYRDRPAEASEIARSLPAEYILEGSLRRAGDRFRITARLVDTKVGHSVWSERYDRLLTDIFELQEDLARSIAHALRIKLSEQEEQAIAHKPTDNLQAYDYYLQGRAYMRRRTYHDLESSLQMFERALSLQPDFALAHASISYVCGILYDWYGQKPEWRQKGISAADRA